MLAFDVNVLSTIECGTQRAFDCVQTKPIDWRDDTAHCVVRTSHRTLGVVDGFLDLDTQARIGDGVLHFRCSQDDLTLRIADGAFDVFPALDLHQLTFDLLVVLTGPELPSRQARIIDQIVVLVFAPTCQTGGHVFGLAKDRTHSTTDATACLSQHPKTCIDAFGHQAHQIAQALTDGFVKPADFGHATTSHDLASSESQQTFIEPLLDALQNLIGSCLQADCGVFPNRIDDVAVRLDRRHVLGGLHRLALVLRELLS